MEAKHFPPNERTPPPWRLRELVERSRERVAEHGDSRRVRWRPNERLVRYYTTLGLLDRPVEMRGRTAYYGPRHLLQLLAIKQEQLTGRSLEEIQRRLAGLPDARLRELARLPLGWEQEAPDEVPEPPREPAPEAAAELAERFWERAPAAPAAAPADRDLPRTQPPAPPAPLAGLQLGPGAQLILDARLAARIEPAALEALTRPLIEFLDSVRGKERDDG